MCPWEYKRVSVCSVCEISCGLDVVRVCIWVCLALCVCFGICVCKYVWVLGLNDLGK